MVTKVDHGNHRSNNCGNHCSNHSGYYDGYYDAELNFRSRILKFRLQLQKPRSFGRLYSHNFHHFPHHFHHYGQVGIKKTDRSPKTNDKQPGLPKNQKRED